MIKKLLLFIIWVLLSIAIQAGSCYLIELHHPILNVSLCIIGIFYIWISIKTKCFTQIEWK